LTVVRKFKILLRQYGFVSGSVEHCLLVKMIHNEFNLQLILLKWPHKYSE